MSGGALKAGRLNLQDPKHIEVPIQAAEEHKAQVAAEAGAMHEHEQKEHAEKQQHARATAQEQARFLQQRMGSQAPHEEMNANTAAATAEADAKLQRELELRSKAAAATESILSGDQQNLVEVKKEAEATGYDQERRKLLLRYAEKKKRIEELRQQKAQSFWNWKQTKLENSRNAIQRWP